MKRLIIITMLFSTLIGVAQEKWSTKSGTITFEASVPSFEEVKAKNEQVGAILKSDGTMACLALMNGFRFKVALMEEHFNENYAESDQYPKAVLKGKIQDLDLTKLNEVPMEHMLDGSINMHGQTKNISVPVMLWKEGSGIGLSSEFLLSPGDFGIDIPSVVANKIAEEVAVSVSFKLEGS